MTDEIPEVAVRDNPPGLTDAEKLAALETYIKTLKTMADGLRARVTEDLGARRVERVGAYLPDGTKMATVGYSGGRKTAKVTDEAAALRWCITKYPAEIVRAVNPAFLKALTDYALMVGQIGEPGVDPRTGEVLDFIQVVQGSPYVRITTTPEGFGRMEALALGFAGMLEASTDENGGPPAGGTVKWADGVVTAPDWTGGAAEDQYDPAFADRLENGAYDRG